MRFEKLTFENEQGDRLSARLDLPVDGEPVACAVFAHCFTCSKNLKAAANISRALSRQGLAVLRFDFTGLGESEGAFSETTFSSNVGDLVAAAQFLEAHYEAPAVLIGHSLGGAAVLQAAVRLPSVLAVATIGAPFDPAHVTHLFQESIGEIEGAGEACVVIGGREFTVKRQFIDDLQTQEARENLGRLGRALLIFHSPVDETVGIENAELIYRAAKHPKSFVSLDTADHLLTDPADSDYVGHVLAAWARKYIGTPQEDRKHVAPDDNQVTARLEGAGFRTELLANGFPLVADEPRAVGGTNTGPTPYDYVVAGLGACTAMTLRMYADRKKWPLDAVEVRLNHSKVHAKDCEDCDKPSKIDHVQRTVVLTGDLDDAQRARLLEIADRCPVHRTLEGEVRIETEAAEAREAST
ncbi:MAG: bifunctional alpha/beta hydrolase/OsmC family protein [Rhodothermales bacterium]|nr:bifunctional alpha/beta hydrolase/OsmC family protein [Rhodothermales bacterium]